MHNKLRYLTLALITSFSFINTAYSEPAEPCYSENTSEITYAPNYGYNGTWYPENSSQTYAPNYGYNEMWAPEDYSGYGVYDSYRYFSVGVGPIVFIPNLGVGFRERRCQFGWDANLSFSTIGYAHQLSANIVGLYYLNPYEQSSPYVGLGLLGSGIFGNHKKWDSVGTLSPDFVFGKEFERTDCSRHFIEMHVAVPTLVMGSHHSKAMYFPLMYVKYGISF